MPAITTKPITLAEFQKKMSELYAWSQFGCSNGDCQISTPKGMHTNATCQCSPRQFAESLLWLACEVEKHGKHARWPKAPPKPAER